MRTPSYGRLLLFGGTTVLVVLGLVWAILPRIFTARVGQSPVIHETFEHLAATGGYARTGIPSSVLWSHVIQHPGAAFIYVYVERQALVEGDKIQLATSDGRIVDSSEGSTDHGRWLGYIEGDTAQIRIVEGVGPKNSADGIVITRYGITLRDAPRPRWSW